MGFVVTHQSLDGPPELLWIVCVIDFLYLNVPVRVVDMPVYIVRVVGF